MRYHPVRSSWSNLVIRHPATSSFPKTSVIIHTDSIDLIWEGGSDNVTAFLSDNSKSVFIFHLWYRKWKMNSVIVLMIVVTRQKVSDLCVFVLYNVYYLWCTFIIDASWFYCCGPHRSVSGLVEMDEKVDGWNDLMAEWMHSYAYGWVDMILDMIDLDWLNRKTLMKCDVLMNEWSDGWVDVWNKRWMDGWWKNE